MPSVAGSERRRALARLLPAAPAAIVAWVVAGAALVSDHALTGIHGYTGTGYDDGVYLGAAVRLLHGQVPYLDLDLLHPPGIVWLGLPFAALGELTHPSVGLAAARLLTVVVAGVNVLLAAAVVRSGGRVAMITTSGLLALMPVSYGATQTFLLEPYVVLFALAGLALLGTHAGELAPGRRVLLAGALVGLAVSLKLFGALIALGVLLALVPRWRVARAWALGVAAGALLPVLPFAVTAPGAFVRDVVVAQLRRGDRDRGADLHDRLTVVLGLDSYPDPSSRAVTVLAVGLLLVVAGLVVLALRRRLTRMHAVCVVVAIITFGGMSQQRQFFDHYAYVVVAGLVLPVGLAVAALVDAVPVTAVRARWLPAGVALLLAAGAVLLVPDAVERSRAYTAASSDPGPLIRTYVPSGSCVATDVPTMLLVADRVPTGCDVPLDPFGIWFTDDDGAPPGAPPPYEPAFVDRWTDWLEEADYVVLSVQRSSFLPWTPQLVDWFDQHYVLVGSGPSTFVYYRIPVA